MTATTTLTAQEIEQIQKQNAMLLRALLRVKAERDAFARQLAERQAGALR